MYSIKKTSMLIIFGMVVAVLQFLSTEAMARSSFFSSRGCTSCHSSPVAVSCDACHEHGARNLSGTTNKSSYAPGETVSVTFSGGSRGGWVQGRLYDQDNQLIGVSSGNASGMGSSTTLPTVFSGPAPTEPGTYTWKVAWFGNSSNTGSNHGEVAVNTNSFTVAAPADTASPVVNAFTLPATSTTLTVPVTTLTASDNVGVTGYLVTTSASTPAAGATGWSASAPSSVTASGEGSITFYAWGKDAAGNVSAAVSASVTITLPDTTAPILETFTLPDTSDSLSVPISSLDASDNVGVTGYLVTTSASTPAAGATGWSASEPDSVTAPGEGASTFYAWAKDAAGNVSAALSATVVVSIAPVTHFPAPNETLLTATFNGEVLVDGNVPGASQLAVTGDEIAVFDPDGVLCGLALVTIPGEFGPLTVFGDDPATPADEGANSEDALTLVLWDSQRQKELPVRILQLNGDRQLLAWSDGGGAAVSLLGLAQERIGTFQRQDNGLSGWYRDADNNGEWSPDSLGGTDLQVGSFGTMAMAPVVGDWNGDGLKTIGTFEKGQWYLDMNGNDLWEGPSGGDLLYTFGSAAMTPVVGDWNGDGQQEIGAFEKGQWYLDANGNGQWDGSGGGDLLYTFGTASMTPVVGDWDGDGQQEIGAFEKGQWYLDTNGNGQWDGSGGGDLTYTFGTASMTPVVGDWDGDGQQEIGAFEKGQWYLDANGDGQWDGLDRSIQAFGMPSGYPFAGSWK